MDPSDAKNAMIDAGRMVGPDASWLITLRGVMPIPVHWQKVIRLDRLVQLYKKYMLTYAHCKDDPRREYNEGKDL